MLYKFIKIMLYFIIKYNICFVYLNVKMFNIIFCACLAFLIGAVTLLVCENITMADEVPAFFLKIAKIPTLPRVGRSGRFEDFFYKAEKHIPRIGRSSQQQVSDYWNIIIIVFLLYYCIRIFWRLHLYNNRIINNNS